jgi:hypothetical protein
MLLIVLVTVLLPLPPTVRLAAVTLLTAFLPGYFLLDAVGLRGHDGLEQLLLAIGCSYALTIITTLTIVYVAGHLSVPLIAASLGLISLGLIVVGLLRGPGEPFSSRPSYSFFLIPVAVAGFFSLTGLGYSDYWGDEMNGLLRAISIIDGHAETIFEHTKGPVEILLPAAYGLLAGNLDPFILRFPFALAYIAGVGGFFLLVQRLFSREVALLAGLILAINGLYLAFGRMVQYQAVVFLMTGLSLLLAYHFYRSGDGKALSLSLFLVATGLLAHYDMLLVLPPLGYLIWRRLGWNWPAWKQTWPPLALAGIILASVTAYFYLPFFLNPHATETSAYLTRRISASGLISNNFDEFYMFAIMYNSGYYMLFITLLALGFIGLDLTRTVYARRQDKRFWSTIVGTIILSVLILLIGQSFLIPLLLSTLLFLILVGFSSSTVEIKFIYVWVGVSFIGYVFFVDHPRTHLRIIYPGWTVLAALALARSLAYLRQKAPGIHQRWQTVGAGVILGLLLALFAAYAYLLFVDVEREYIFTYPAHKSRLYWEDPDFPFGSRRLYGAPHRLGWQMINQLYSQGELQGDWDSNDFGSNLFWYTLGASRNPCYPRYYFLTQFEQKEDEVESLPDLEANGYVHIGQVWNRDRLQIDVYEFAPTASNTDDNLWYEPSTYRALVLPTNFDSLPYRDNSLTKEQISQKLPNLPTFQPSPAALAQIAENYRDPRINQVRDRVVLVGYNLDERWARPGGAILLTLYWQAADVVNLPYKVFTHLKSNPGKLWAQADDFPACGTQPTNQWQVGELVADRHFLRLPEDIPPGQYLIQVGLYEPKTGLRMDLLDPMDNPQGVYFELPEFKIPADD